MGTKAEGDMCYAAAMPDEPMFVLLARDPRAPQLVRDWAHDRQAEISLGHRPPEDQAKVDEAMQCARRMEAWRIENDGAWRNSQFQCGEAPKLGDGTPDAALAIGEHAFRAGVDVAYIDITGRAPPEHFKQKAWSNYDPPEEIKALS